MLRNYFICFPFSYFSIHSKCKQFLSRSWAQSKQDIIKIIFDIIFADLPFHTIFCNRIHDQNLPDTFWWSETKTSKTHPLNCSDVLACQKYLCYVQFCHIMGCFRRNSVIKKQLYICQKWARIRPMLPASVQFWPTSGPLSWNPSYMLYTDPTWAFIAKVLVKTNTRQISPRYLHSGQCR